MIILLLIFGFVLALAFCWLGSLFIFCGAKVFKSPEMARPAGKFLSWASALAVLTGAALWYLFFPLATVVYQREFGESPSSDVRNLIGEDDSYYDSKVINLRFQAAPSTIKKLAKIQKLPLVARSQFESFKSGGSDSADWWQPSVTLNSQCYALQRENASFAHEEISLLYDPQTQIAYYSFFGID